MLLPRSVRIPRFSSFGGGGWRTDVPSRRSAPRRNSMTTPNVPAAATVIPPNPPWRELNPTMPLEGYVSYYLSDDLSGLPVRAVTLLRNNKSDPNLETKTYGLFSTCGHGMRASIGKNRYGV